MVILIQTVVWPGSGHKTRGDFILSGIVRVDAILTLDRSPIVLCDAFYRDLGNFLPCQVRTAWVKTTEAFAARRVLNQGKSLVGLAGLGIDSPNLNPRIFRVYIGSRNKRSAGRPSKTLAFQVLPYSAIGSRIWAPSPSSVI